VALEMTKQRRIKMNTSTANAYSIKWSILKWSIASVVFLLLSGLPTSVYAEQLNAPNSDSNSDATLVCMGILFLGWIGLAMWGMVKIIQKGYLSDTTCAVWGLLILIGWWAIPILLGLGPIWLGIAAMLEAKKRCPHCRSMIPESATRCAHCQAELGEQKANSWVSPSGLVLRESSGATAPLSTTQEPLADTPSGINGAASGALDKLGAYVAELPEVSDETINKLLQGFQDPMAYNREAALKEVGQAKLTDPRIIRAMEILATSDRIDSIRDIAKRVLDTLNQG
jgi:hypothetical protein